MPLEFVDGRARFVCTAHDIDPETILDYEDLMMGEYCEVCEWHLDVLGRCPFRNEPDHIEARKEQKQ